MALLYKQKHLKHVTQAELDEAVKKHDMFARARVGGARAIFTNRDLSGLNFKNLALAGADFSGALLSDADMRGANFDGALFFTANLHRADLSGANLARADMRGTDLSGAVFNDANMTAADLREGAMAVKDRRGNINLSLQAGKNAPDAKRLAGGSFTEYVNASEALFIGTRMQKCTLRDANLTGAIFEGADLSFAQVESADFHGAVLLNTNVNGVDFSAADMSGVLRDEILGLSLDDAFEPLEHLIKHHRQWVETQGAKGRRMDFTRYDLRGHPGQEGVDFKGTLLTMIKARHAIFFHLRFSDCEMQAADLRECDFRLARFDRADLRGSDFSGSKMARANFQLARLAPLLLPNGKHVRTDLSRCGLRYADFTGADLREVNFAGSDLSHADLRGANIQGADLTGTKTDNAYFDKPN